MKVAGVVLAAGASRRLGSAKQMVRLGGKTLLARAVGAAVEAGLQPVYVVLAADAEFSLNDAELAEALRKGDVEDKSLVVPVLNDAASEGMAASIRVGVETAAARAKETATDLRGVVILACDQPTVTADHLRELIEGCDAVVGSAYAGRKGVPAYFPARVFGELLQLRGDVGARDLLRGARAVELEGGELDVDTADDLETALRRYGV